MKTFKINKQQIQLPTSWSEIKLGNYEKWYLKAEHQGRSELEFIASLSNIDVATLADIPLGEVGAMTQLLDFTAHTALPPSDFILINGLSYKVVPFNKLTFGEWIDIEGLYTGYPETYLSELLAIVCRPLGEKYNHELTEERALMFRKQTCDKILPLVSFFLRRKIELDETLSLYSKAEEEVNQFLLATKNSAPSGAGTKRLPIWHRIMYYFLTKLLKKQLSKFSDFYSIA